MITANEFLAAWSACNEAPTFARFAPSAMTRFNVSSEDLDFLANVGLPSFAAPHMSFFRSDEDGLPTPCDPFGISMELEAGRFGMVGCTAENWPICLDVNRPREIVCLRLEPGYPQQRLNTSFLKLAECLLAYCQTVDETLAYGKLHDDDDAWRHRRYPPEFDTKLSERLRCIDPEAFDLDSYWAWHFLHRNDSDSLPKL